MFLVLIANLFIKKELPEEMKWQTPAASLFGVIGRWEFLELR